VRPRRASILALPDVGFLVAVLAAGDGDAVVVVDP
jgi:hypothetical protein